MNGQPTPGPWYSGGPMDFDNYVVQTRKGALAHVHPPNADANARLMAAAPQLLEAAKATRAWMDAAATRGARVPMQAHELRVLVKNAIEKAEKRDG